MFVLCIGCLKYEDVLLKNIYFIADTKKKFEFVKERFPKINMCLLEKHDINNLNECIKGFNVKKFDQPGMGSS